jgi:hypothetical protein
MHVRRLAVACLAVCAPVAACGGGSDTEPTTQATGSSVTPTVAGETSTAPLVVVPGPTAPADPNALSTAVTTDGIGWTMQIAPTWTEVSELDVPAVATWLLDGEGLARLTVERYVAADLAAYETNDAESYLGFTAAQTLSTETSTTESGTEFWRGTAVAEWEGEPVGLTTIAVDTGDEVIAARYIAPSETYAATTATIEQFLLTLQPA